MVDRTKELELALGSTVKKVEDNEMETVILQRRSIRTKRDLFEGDVIQINDLEFLRPCPNDAIAPYEVNNVIGKKVGVFIEAGDSIKWKSLK